jgi:glucuronate isomerase
MRRFQDLTPETIGPCNTMCFNEDTRACLSILARHVMARGCDCSFLATRVTEHRPDEEEAHGLAAVLAFGHAKNTVIARF